MFKAHWQACTAIITFSLVAVWLLPVAGQKATLPMASEPPASPPSRPGVQPQVAKHKHKLPVIVRVPSGKDIPESLKKYMVKAAKFKHARLKIDAEAQDAILQALKHPDLHVELERPKAVTPIFEVAPFNRDARISHRVPEFEADFPEIRGESVKVAVFDQGRIRATHQEFQQEGMSRVTIKTTKSISRHSTHCAGTVGAKGVEAQAMGMATRVKIFSYDWDDDTIRLSQDAANFQVSSHSYGPLSGWVAGYPMQGVWNWWGGLNNSEDSRYGKYTDDCSRLDEVLATHRHLVTFFAAGNDRGKGPQSQPTLHYVVATGTYSSRVRPRTGGTTGLDSVTGSGLAKNAICIGAINDIPSGGGTADIQITSFTGVGPADDGRIKPDLVANGFQLFSTSDSGDDSYVELSGTSMATPTSSGIAALLWEHYKKTKDRNSTSAEIKAALIHTARDGGVAGPDPQYGWGAIDAQAAGRLIKGTNGQLIDDPSKNVVKEGETKTFTFTATGAPIRATVVWTDPAAPPNGGGIDDATPALRNDLDLRVVSPTGTIFLPYSLDLANLWDTTTGQPTRARTDRPNRVDNVEVVDAKTANGVWKVEVKGFKLKAGSSQAFALAVSGLKPTAE